jgi:hypothetical protein
MRRPIFPKVFKHSELASAPALKAGGLERRTEFALSAL